MNEDEIKNIVIEGYRNTLKRDPDPPGLKNYIDEIKNGLSKERFYEILKMSEEYKRCVYKDTITYCMIGYNKLHEIKLYIETVLPYIDRFIFMDGGPDGISIDGTIQYLHSLNMIYDNKIEMCAHRWKDNFSDMRNSYIGHFTKKQNSGWILVSDTDEHFPISTVSKLKDVIRTAESENYNGIKIRAYDIITDDIDHNKLISEKMSNFWKPLLFKYSNDIYYEGDVHETLKGNIKWKSSDLIYRHIRSQRKVYERAVQNFWISSINSPKWADFRLLCTNNNISNFNDFFKIYKEGNLHKDIENWIYNHRNYDDNSGNIDILEIRDTAKLYFEILHPNKR